MTSWQARCVNALLRAGVRRRDWGDERALTRRARRLFGAPAPWAWLHARGLRRVPVRAAVRGGAVRGEWLEPPAPAPGAVLYVHGGGFVSCSPRTHRPVTAALARLTGRRVFAVDYRLAPEHRFPAALDDVAAAYAWLLDAGVPAHAVAVAGDSAGGGLALSLLRRVRAGGGALPACAACLSPWADLTGGGDSVRGNDGRDPMFRPENMAQFASVYLGVASPRHPDASPALAPDLAGLPPLLLQVGATELLLDDARRVDALARRAGVASRLTVYDGVPHAWPLLVGLVPEARAALVEIADFMREHLDGA